MTETKDVNPDDFPLGQSTTTHGRTINDGEMMVLHHLIGAVTPMYANFDYAKAHNPSGTSVLSGAIVAAIVAADWSNTRLYKRLVEELGVRVTTDLTMNVKYQLPMKPGDTLYGTYTLTDVRPAEAKSRYGVMTVEMIGENQDRELVINGDLSMTFRRIAEGADV